MNLTSLRAKLRQLDLENDFFGTCAYQGGIAQRKAMIDRKYALPITRPAQMLGISRGAVYCLPRPTSPAELDPRRRIDELHLE